MNIRSRALLVASVVSVFTVLLPSCSTPPPPKPAAAIPPPAATPVPTPTPRAFNYPPAAKGDVVEDYFGTKVADPYRWMEKADDAATVAWVNAENALTQKLLDRPGRAAIEKRLEELYNFPKIDPPYHRGPYYFFGKNSGLQNQSVYYVQKGLTGQPRALIDPNTLSPDGTVALTNTSPSRDGRLLGYALSKSGSDRQEIFVREVATGKDLPDHLLWMKFSPITWTRDGKGFYYSHLAVPGTVPAGDEHYFPKLYYHRLGDPQEKDRLVFEKPGEKEVAVSSDISWDGRWLILYANKGASDKTEIQVVDLKRPGFKPALVFSGYEHGYNVADIVDGRLYAWTDRDAPTGRMVVVDLRRLPSGSTQEAAFRELVPATKDKLVFGGIVDRKLVLNYLHNASTSLVVDDLEGRPLAEVGLPGIGAVGGIFGSLPDKDMFFDFSSFTAPPTVYRYELAEKRLTVFQKPDVPVDVTQYETAFGEIKLEPHAVTAGGAGVVQ